MPNIKDLFKQHDSSGKVLSSKSITELTSSHDAESFGYIQGYQKEKGNLSHCHMMICFDWSKMNE